MVLPRVLLLVLALIQATGIGELVRRQVCEAECRYEGCGADCTPWGESPSCSCHCPSLQAHTPPRVAEIALPAPTEAARPQPPDDRQHPSPDPREISHVPRPV